MVRESTDSNSGDPLQYQVDRSPVDIAISPDERWMVSANQTSDTVSLVEIATGKVVDEVACGSHPIDLDFTPDGKRILVTSKWSGTLHTFSITNDGNRMELNEISTITLGADPHGLAISSDGTRAYVGLVATAQVAQIDLIKQKLIQHFEVGRWPMYMTLSPDDKRLAVGNGGDSNIMVVDTETGKQLYDERLSNCTNLGQMRTSSDGKYAYFTWMVYRTNPITVSNIQRGWVLASRIGRVRLDGPAYREAISLDVPRRAVADPHDLVISDDGNRLVASSSGTHELLVYRLPDLPFVSAGGPGDLIDRKLQNDRDRFDRIEVGGRPMGMRMLDDSQTIYVANYLRNSVQVVDIKQKEVIREIPLGSAKELTLARKGMEIFYDAGRSLDQWYSCHSCHQEGGGNARVMDTLNDGTNGTLKTVLPLFSVGETFPWTWHGWQKDLTEAMHKSITSTMLGKAPTASDKEALIAFMKSMPTPPNPFRGPSGEISASAQRGKKVFFSKKAACVDCHNGPHFTDGKIHDVGLGRSSDHYRGYNTPTLNGVYRKNRFLHNGKAKSLESVVTDLHSPEKVNGEGDLNDGEVADLIEYLKTL